MLPVFANEPLLFGGDGSDDDGKGDSLPRASSSGAPPPPPPPPPSPPSPSVARSVERADLRHGLGPMGELFPPIDPQQQPSAAKPTLHRLPGPAQSLCRGQQHQTGLLDDEAGVDTLPSLLPPPARRPRPLSCATAGGEHGILLALGILSGGAHTELRDAARQTWLRFDPVGQSVVACFAVGVPPPAFGAALHAEMARHADLIFVNATAVADGSAMQAAETVTSFKASAPHRARDAVRACPCDAGPSDLMRRAAWQDAGLCPKLTVPSELLDKTDVFIFDCDGVIWKGDALIDRVPKVLRRLHSQ